MGEVWGIFCNGFASTCVFLIEIVFYLLLPVAWCFGALESLSSIIFHHKPLAQTEAEFNAAQRIDKVSIGTDVIFDGYTPYEEAKPCSQCLHISIEDLLSPEGLAHCKSYEELHGAAREGCKFGTMLMLTIERSAEKEKAELWMAFRSTNPDYLGRLTLMLVARDGTDNTGLKSDLVEVMLQRMITTGVRREVLAVIGVYADEGRYWSTACFLMDSY